MCRVRAPGGALAGTVSDIKLPGVVLFLCVSNESRKMERIKFGESLLSERTCSFFGDAANAASVRCSEAESNCMWTHCVRKETNAASVRCSEAESNCM